MRKVERQAEYSSLYLAQTFSFRIGKDLWGGMLEKKEKDYEGSELCKSKSKFSCSNYFQKLFKKNWFCRKFVLYLVVH